MPQLVNNGYESYELSDSERIEGHYLNYLTLAVIQNLKMEAVEQKLALVTESMDEAGKAEYWKQEAYLRGQIEAYTHLQQSHAESARIQSQLEEHAVQLPQESSPI